MALTVQVFSRFVLSPLVALTVLGFSSQVLAQSESQISNLNEGEVYFSKDEAIKWMEQNPVFYAHGPKLPISGQGIENCIVDSIWTSTAKIGRENISFNSAKDISDCAKYALTRENSVPVTQPDAAVRSVLYLGCNGVDFSIFQGKTLQEVVQMRGIFTRSKDLRSVLISLCPTSAKVEVLENVRTFMRSKIRYDSTDAQSHMLDSEVETLLSYETPEGEPCLSAGFQNYFKLTSGCRLVQRTSWISSHIDGRPTAVNGLDDYAQYDSDDLEYPFEAKSPFFKAGTMQIYRNGWRGKVDYSPGFKLTQAGPAWSLKRGSETIRGFVKDPK